MDCREVVDSYSICTILQILSSQITPHTGVTTLIRSPSRTITLASYLPMTAFILMVTEPAVSTATVMFGIRLKQKTHSQDGLCLSFSGTSAT